MLCYLLNYGLLQSFKRRFLTELGHLNTSEVKAWSGEHRLRTLMTNISVLFIFDEEGQPKINNTDFLQLKIFLTEIFKLLYFDEFCFFIHILENQRLMKFRANFTHKYSQTRFPQTCERCVVISNHNVYHCRQF